MEATVDPPSRGSRLDADHPLNGVLIPCRFTMSGSDTGNASAFSHGRWHGKEAELFAKEVGMPPMEAIVANTSRNAWLMGLEGEVGVIAPGKLADIVIWNSDPLADITVLQRPSEISTIIKDGRVVDREAGGFRELPDELPRAPASISG